MDITSGPEYHILFPEDEIWKGPKMSFVILFQCLHEIFCFNYPLLLSFWPFQDSYKYIYWSILQHQEDLYGIFLSFMFAPKCRNGYHRALLTHCQHFSSLSGDLEVRSNCCRAKWLVLKNFYHIRNSGNILLFLGRKEALFLLHSSFVLPSSNFYWKRLLQPHLEFETTLPVIT